MSAGQVPGGWAAVTFLWPRWLGGLRLPAEISYEAVLGRRDSGRAGLRNLGSTSHPFQAFFEGLKCLRLILFLWPESRSQAVTHVNIFIRVRERIAAKLEVAEVERVRKRSRAGRSLSKEDLCRLVAGSLTFCLFTFKLEDELARRYVAVVFCHAPDPLTAQRVSAPTRLPQQHTSTHARLQDTMGPQPRETQETARRETTATKRSLDCIDCSGKCLTEATV